MSDGDVAALWSWLQAVKPVKNSVDVNQLHFPFNMRVAMAGWDALFFDAGLMPVIPQEMPRGIAAPIW